MLSVENDEEDEEDEEDVLAMVDIVLLLVVVVNDDEVVILLDIEELVAVVRVVELGEKVVSRMVVCRMVVVTGCGQMAPIPLPSRNFPMSSFDGAETPLQAVWRNAVSSCRPSMHACEQPRW